LSDVVAWSVCVEKNDEKVEYKAVRNDVAMHSVSVYKASYESPAYGYLPAVA
jgi:hypothetical protein